MTSNESRVDVRSAWAESMGEFGPDTQIYGPETRDVLTGLLDGTPAADEQEVTRRLRGRPSLNAGAEPGRHARKLNIRISNHLSDLMRQHIAQQQLKGESELVRLALTEYLDNHRIPA